MNQTTAIEILRNNQIISAQFTTPEPGLDQYTIPGCNQPGQTRITLQLPIADAAGFWYGSLQPGARMHLDWNIHFCCGAQYQYPVFALMQRNSCCNCAVTLSNLWDDTTFTAVLDQEHECYKLQIVIAHAAAATKPFQLRLDRRHLPLDQTLSDWRTSLELPAHTFPAAAWDPVYCTWYARHGAVDAAWLEPTAERAVNMGFKTLIVDDGWCYDEYCRVNPDTIADWYHTIGDYQVSQVKFPHFAEHVRRVQAMGMNYMLWVAPHLIGFDSKFYQQHPDAVIEPRVEGYRRLNVHDPAMRNLITQRMAALMREGNLDGLKIDFIDIVRPAPDAPNALATLDFAREPSNAVRSIRPDALIEFRQSYTNCAMLSLGTQFRAGDAPFDYQKNFGRVAEIRLALGDNIPVHADPAFWSKTDPMECVARHMIAMLGGVPMLSMDLLTLSSVEEKVIRNWMNFYSQHQALLNHGHWSILLNNQNIAAMTVEDDQQKIVLLNDANYAEKLIRSTDKKLFMANLSEQTADVAAGHTTDGCGAIVNSRGIPVGGLGEF